MTTRRVEDVALQVRSLLAIGPTSSLTDGQLVSRFASGEAGVSSLAFEALVERHGPMVSEVCRGVLRDVHDAQDASQATFLVLVRRAGSIRDRDSVASWLHGVALRVARHARGVKARRHRLEREAAGPVESNPANGLADDLGPKLHEEVGRLPERYRAAVVLCYLEGHTCEDAARVLGWPVGTVKSRLSRARDRLRDRLSRAGFSSAMLPVDPRPIPPLSPGVARSIAAIASRFAIGSSLPASGAVALAEGVLKLMTLAKWKSAASAALAAAAWPVIVSALTPPKVVPDPPVSVPSTQAEVALTGPQVQATDPLALTTPRQLVASAGNGTALVYPLDDRGERIFLVEETAKTRRAARADAIRQGKVAKLGPLPANSYKQVDAPVRWVVISGVIDNQAIHEALIRAGKVEPAEAYPYYRRFDAERQVRRPDGNWSDWARIDRNKDYDILDNLPELSKERMPEEFRPNALVDHLPRLKVGTWSGVDPEPILRLAKPGPDEFIGDRWLHRSPLVAVRLLNFGIESGETYRYRLRVVLFNPEARKTVGIGRNVTDIPPELSGPWSEPTEAVAVP